MPFDVMDEPAAPAAADPGADEEARIVASARFLGARIATDALEQEQAVATVPLTLRLAEGGHAVVFRFGVVVFVDVEPRRQASLVRDLAALVLEPFPEPELEELDVVVRPDGREGLDPRGSVVVRQLGLGRIQIVAQVLAKSVVLAHYEEEVAGVFDRVERLARQLREGSAAVRGRELQREIGGVLLIQARTIGRAEVTEKPELTWEDPELEELYERLEAEYELRDRDVALDRKLQLVARTAQTYLDVVHARQSLRVEWYIVILILVEIVLVLYEMAAGP